VPYTINAVAVGLTHFGMGIAENASGNIAGKPFTWTTFKSPPRPSLARWRWRWWGFGSPVLAPPWCALIIRRNLSNGPGGFSLGQFFLHSGLHLLLLVFNAIVTELPYFFAGGVS